ncbi:MAG: hypothetical protein KME56_19930 [Candidatus Thiodiazotropha sp. (ex Ctena orbiculata)]|nr:hypothetical protein [Candidatus Thiodiazotropha taylori]MBT2998886.1 hypothetical protein [Candidatus Thiodiazotropha taylori]MBT3002834.1 hypothetical protein [Candidatus Thiodiazotropha taylori]MBV2108860.1 hypothetical protein [Candidatus Thiodiazotropha taylori]MBV2110771.1 hypothetical protein [Candidatus Thiodiazotropha taylori]
MNSKTVLVTGAPRSGTTPVGDLIGTLNGAYTLYEPMGPTGDIRIKTEFPMPGEASFTYDDLKLFHQDLVNLKISYKSQVREGHTSLQRIRARIFGSRSLLSYRLAKMQLNKEILVWKDPHAIFCAGVLPNVSSVITIRPPEAHAASYKRLGWVSRIDEIYPRYNKKYGEIKGFDELFQKYSKSVVGSAALLWRLVYQYVLDMPKEQRNNCYLLNFENEESEIAAYEKLFAWIGYPITDSARKR